VPDSSIPARLPLPLGALASWRVLFGKWLVPKNKKLARHYSQNGRFKHGLSHRPEYKAYQDAKRRCTSPNCKDWSDYGGRGIKMLYTDFQHWLHDLGERPGPEYSVDRVDVNGNYEPGNLRWATASEQIQNRRKSAASTDPETGKDGIDFPDCDFVE
jgi:hypothetical protein